MIPQTLAGTAALTERLRLYARYMSVVAEQLASVHQARGDRLAELANERRELESRLGDGASDPIPPLGRMDDLLSLGLAALDENLETTQLLEDRWSSLSARALQTARNVDPLLIRGGQYPDTTEMENRLDRRF